jgi:hypothetical protein
VTVIRERAGLAALIATPDGPRVAVEAGGRSVAIHRPDGALDAALVLADPDLRLMPGPDRAAAGTRLPPGWLAAAHDGRSPTDAVLIRLDDGADVDLREVSR